MDVPLNTKEEKSEPEKDTKTVSNEIEKIGERVVKVRFVEYTGKRKKKVTHIEVKVAELEEMMKKSCNPVQAQFSLF